jgi:hypothetical protein
MTGKSRRARRLPRVLSVLLLQQENVIDDVYDARFN